LAKISGRCGIGAKMIKLPMRITAAVTALKQCSPFPSQQYHEGIILAFRLLK